MKKQIFLAVLTAFTPILQGAAQEEQPEPLAAAARSDSEKKPNFPGEIVSLASYALWSLIRQELAQGNPDILKDYASLTARLSELLGMPIYLEAKHLSEIAEIFYLNSEPIGPYFDELMINLNDMPKWLQGYFHGVSLQDLINHKLLFTRPGKEEWPDLIGRQLKDLKGLPNLSNIRERYALQIEPRNRLTHIDPEDFKECIKLENLFLSWNRIERLQAGAFKYLVNLIYLRLSQGNPLIDIEPGAFDGLVKLERLELDSNNFTVLKKGTFRGLTKLNNLDVSNSAHFQGKLKIIEPGTFDDLISLEELWIRYTGLSYEDKERITGEVLAVAPNANIIFGSY